MIGLRSKLVLRDVSSAQELQERRIIIPWGEVTIAKEDEHVAVSVPHGTGIEQKYFVYSIDRHLRKLRGQQDVLGTLYKAYLHAITSFALPDPFTGRTGTEESIATLKEASLFSCAPLHMEEQETLALIKCLTPERLYYPKHKTAMQTVCWHPSLSPLAQHDDFSLAASAIFAHHAQTELMFDLDQRAKVPVPSRGDAILLARARRSNASVMKSGLFSDMELSSDDDKIYCSRDHLVNDDRAKRVFEIASLIKAWPPQIATHAKLTEVVKVWGIIRGYHAKFNLSSLEDLSSLVFSDHFGSLYQICRQALRRTDTYSLMFKLCPVALGAETDGLVHLRTLLAFAFSEYFAGIHSPPSETQYTLGQGSAPDVQTITWVISKYATNYELPNYPTKTDIEEFETKESEQELQEDALAKKVFNIWPGASVSVVQQDYQYFNTTGIVHECQGLFDEWHKNRRFLKHIQKVEARLASMQTSQVVYNVPAFHMSRFSQEHAIHTQFTLTDLLQARSGRLSIRPTPQLVSTPPRSLENASQVKRLVSVLNTGSSSTHKEYRRDLSASVEALEGRQSDCESGKIALTHGQLDNHRGLMIMEVKMALEAIREALSPCGTAASIVDSADLWPRLSESCLLSQLSRNNVDRLPAHWKVPLLQLGEKMASLQRSERMALLHGASNKKALWNELKCAGRDGWTATEYPSWLLLEIENNITIRPLQAKVAKEMIAPGSGRNSVLQLNMGEGKSSVIVPMLATALAAGEKLARVVVLKPLLRQTEQVLTQRLGGLLGHRVGHVPFSRKTKIDVTTVRIIQNTFQKYAQGYGVLVALPEELLSMKLMTREKLASGSTLAAEILDMYRWLKVTARDILDESDEILSVKSQLIYPVGDQQMLDGKNDRWQIVQAVLRRVELHVKRLANSYPSELELEYSGKAFPLLKFLRPGVFDMLMEFLIEDAISGRIAGVSFDFYSDDTREAVKTYISSREISPTCLETLTTSVHEGPHWDALFILRGLFAHEVLSFSLQRKRWLVEYGLDLRRCLMAVPYRAKGVPSVNSEFGHPDVGILLTCLSYYYTGLTLEQMYTCFVILSKDSNPQDVYDNWTSARDFPWSLKSYEAVNLDDKTLCENLLYPKLQFNLDIISFYLNQIVFPKEGKEFSKRISASGWDIPSTSTDPGLVTTGFSGTNDSRAVLPFSIDQEDLPELLHTNAMVLDLTLRAENRSYLQSVDAYGKKLNVDGLLAMMTRQNPRVNVLIDVGAQVLTATNIRLAQQWLALEAGAHASVFFDEQDEAVVLDRSGAVTPLRISPFSGKLDACLMYLDEVHTRGIDLAIPIGARAMVTLGPRLVKDRLMQACMRLRSLGNGHSLCFVAPPEVHRSIADASGGKDESQLTSFDVLAWTMEQTCQSLEIARPLRAMHGLEMSRQQKVLEKFLPETRSSNAIMSKSSEMGNFWECIQEDDAQTLENLYGINDHRLEVFQGLLDRTSKCPMMQHLISEIETMSKTRLQDSSMDNEQERELEHEIETERRVQRPAKLEPIISSVSKGILDYIASGTAFALSQCEAVNAFSCFDKTTAKIISEKQNVTAGHFRVLATLDFIHSVLFTKGSLGDDYLRPTTWVLSSTETEKLLIISPHEANELLPEIKASGKIHLHTFAARLNKRMARFNHMDFYTPNARPDDVAPAAHAIRDLELFSGSLYVDNMAKYERLCHFLGVATASTRPQNKPVQTDGFVDVKDRKEVGWPEDCPFNRSPLPFFKHILSLRMHGQAFDHSHMGAMLNGRALQEAAFEGCQEIEEIFEEMDIDD
ncbi:hypothetical protein E4T38_00949 [Aureobasidium subglaciale]|nr:hypothetical protein E4T38_00949 [Aureobasidium subglaciale]KAI5230700.1 hypothetical protein E4T40_00950 [Aureobasidium subglaciale]KAI5233752.1 hypothetical protein E4T41_00948 [Aureobasidium subglaciale]KAI5267236.1 hypothetical protein E4T46_00948 [Aureobasidium subglaciale]